MPYVDVTRALIDPMIASRFDVTRRKEDVNDFGESEVTETVICGVVGVVCDAGPDDLQRLPEEQRMGRVISIVTKFRLRGPARDESPAGTQDYQPDLVDWKGARYVVSKLFPYSGYGPGFVQALATAIKFVDKPPSK